MFFDSYDFSAPVIDVLRFRQERRAAIAVSARSFWALSYRHRAQSTLKTKNKTVEVLSRSVVLVPAGIEYTRQAKDEYMTVIHFNPNIPVAGDICVFYPENYSEYEKYFERIYDLWQRKDGGYRIKCNEYFMHLVYMIYCGSEEEKRQTTAAKAARIIEKNISDIGFSIDALASDLGISGAYLRKRFKEEYGVSPCVYLIEKRMEKAASLLETGYFTVKETAFMCGYENEKYFSTAFKKRFSNSPSVYLKNA